MRSEETSSRWETRHRARPYVPVHSRLSDPYSAYGCGRGLAARSSAPIRRGRCQPYRQRRCGSARFGGLARHLDDLDAAINLGERWGVKIARAATEQDLLNSIVRQGPGALEDAASLLGYRPRDFAALEEWIHTGWRPGDPGASPTGIRDRWSEPLPTLGCQRLSDHR